MPSPSDGDGIILSHATVTATKSGEKPIFAHTAGTLPLLLPVYVQPLEYLLSLFVVTVLRIRFLIFFFLLFQILLSLFYVDVILLAFCQNQVLDFYYFGGAFFLEFI